MFILDKIHTQLRRLRNESTILKDAVITAIPSHCSKVMFTTCSQVGTPPQSRSLTDNMEAGSVSTYSICHIL